MRVLSWGLFALLALSCASCGDYGSGEKLGIITRLKQQGVYCKTWEGEIIRGGLNSGSGSFGAPFDFTIEDPNLVSLVKKALETQQQVKVKYHSEFCSFCRSDSQSVFLTAIEFVKLSKSTNPSTPAPTDLRQQVIDILHSLQ